MSSASDSASGTGSRGRLLEAALALVREKGYASTSVEELCARAGVSKGAFFHHFPSKDALALAAVAHWRESTEGLFEVAAYHQHADPLERVLGYLDLRKSLLRKPIAACTCFAGTLIQEVHSTKPDIREACEATLAAHAARLEADLAAAMTSYGVRGTWTAASLALHTQVVLQGAFILAKARGDLAVAADSIEHLRRYLMLLFRPETHREENS